MSVVIETLKEGWKPMLVKKGVVFIEELMQLLKVNLASRR